jgi:glycosyltransferase involved in cell wall biosynthesis
MALDTPYRVLVVHNRYQHKGGEDSVCEAEVALLRQRGHEVRLYERDNAEIDKASPVAVARDSVWSRRTVADFNALALEFRPDIVHVHNTFPLISPSLYAAAAAKRIPVVQTLHNFRLSCLQATFLRDGAVCEDCLGGMPWRGVVRACYRGSRSQSAVLAATLLTHRLRGTYRRDVTRYIALNEFCRRKFVEGGLPADRIVIKPNFVDVADVPRTGGAGGLYVGRLSLEKGIGTLARALTLLSGRAQLDVVGTGPEQLSLEGVSGVRLVGWARPEEVLARMRAAAWVVIPSICYESFPRTLAEAFAVGLPVIASRIGALAELVEHKVTGLLFESGSAHSLAEAIAWAGAHPEEMRIMGSNARAVYESKYTAAENYRRLVDIYDGAVRDTLARGG